MIPGGSRLGGHSVLLSLNEGPAGHSGELFFVHGFHVRAFVVLRFPTHLKEHFLPVQLLLLCPCYFSYCLGLVFFCFPELHLCFSNLRVPP
jgi:hypothetical protein